MKINIKHLSKLLFRTFFLVLAILLISEKQAKAQDFSLSLAPPLLEAVIKPGKTITQVYWLNNQGQTQFFVPLVIPITSRGIEGRVEIDQGLEFLGGKSKYTQIKTDYPWLDWFSLQNNDIKINEAFELKSGQKQQLVLKIKIPDNADIKDYYASLVIFPSSSVFENVNNTRIGGGITSTLLLSVANSADNKTDWQIVKFGDSKLCWKDKCLNLLDSFDTPEIELIVKNNSDMFDKAVGNVKFITGRKILQTENILPENVLSKNMRKLKPADCAGQDCNNFVLEKRIIMGKVLASANIGSAVSSYRFFIFPWKAGLGIIIGFGSYLVLKKLWLK